YPAPPLPTSRITPTAFFHLIIDTLRSKADAIKAVAPVFTTAQIFSYPVRWVLHPVQWVELLPGESYPTKPLEGFEINRSGMVEVCIAYGSLKEIKQTLEAAKDYLVKDNLTPETVLKSIIALAYSMEGAEAMTDTAKKNVCAVLNRVYNPRRNYLNYKNKRCIE